MSRKRSNSVVLTIGPITKDGFRVSIRNTADDDPHVRTNNNPETVTGYMELEDIQQRLDQVKTALRDMIESDFLFSKGLKVQLCKESEYPSDEVTE